MSEVLEIKELPDTKIRLFRSREFEPVAIPEDVLAVIGGDEDCIPVSVSIRPMSHQESEIRKRLKSEIDRQSRLSDQKAGITSAMVKKFVDDWQKCNEILNDKELEDSEKMKKFEDFNAKLDVDHAELIEKRQTQDNSGIYKAQDELLENSVRCVIANMSIMTMKNDIEVAITKFNIDCIHPDLFGWILSKIEDISYLKSGEVLGFR